MGGSRHLDTLKKYTEHAEPARRALFAKDREIRKLNRRLYQAEDMIGWVAEVLSGSVGGTDDKAWMIAAIEESMRAYGFMPAVVPGTDRGEGTG